MCSGSCYDSSIDDYKVILGFRKRDEDDVTCFQVLNLKSNVWRVAGEVKYRFISKVGTLCNGALHWVVHPQNKKKGIIVSFDLSQQDFTEIPQPDDNALGLPHMNMRDGMTDMSLGVMDECLCIFSIISPTLPVKIWKMKAYNVKQSWEMVVHDECQQAMYMHTFGPFERDTTYDLFFSYDRS